MLATTNTLHYYDVNGSDCSVPYASRKQIGSNFNPNEEVKLARGDYAECRHMARKMKKKLDVPRDTISWN